MDVREKSGSSVFYQLRQPRGSLKARGPLRASKADRHPRGPLTHTPEEGREDHAGCRWTLGHCLNSLETAESEPLGGHQAWHGWAQLDLSRQEVTQQLSPSLQARVSGKKATCRSRRETSAGQLQTWPGLPLPAALRVAGVNSAHSLHIQRAPWGQSGSPHTGEHRTTQGVLCNHPTPSPLSLPGNAQRPAHVVTPGWTPAPLRLRVTTGVLHVETREEGDKAQTSTISV